MVTQDKQAICLLLLALLYSATSFAKDDINYRKIHTKKKQIIHTIEVDPAQYSIISVHASSLGKYSAKVDEIAEHFNALVGINGGFFRADQKKRYTAPAGILKIKDKWHGIAYKPRAAIGWYSNKNAKKRKHGVLIDVIKTSTTFRINSKTYKVNSFNPLKPFTKSAAFSFGDKNAFPRIGKCNIKTKNGIVKSVNTKVQNISNKEYVFCLKSKNCALNEQLLNKPAYPKVHVSPEFASYRTRQWNQFDYIVGGVPLLIYNGKKNKEYKKEINSKNFVSKPYARTAIGLMPNNNWLFVVVEENPLLNILGMSIPDLVNFMHSMGCEYALNLDGGSSTSLYVADRIAAQGSSSPLDSNLLKVRPVSDAILVVPKG